MTETQMDSDDQENSVSSRPKPCKVPGINIFPSPDQEINTSLIPATHNTGGSLPDLTNIQFPSPLPTPLDPDDSASGLSVSSSTGNLTVGSHTNVTLTSSSPGITPSQPTMSVTVQGQPEGVVPLILNTDPNQQPALQQLSPTLSPTFAQALTIDAATLEQQLAQYTFFTQSQVQTQVAGGQQQQQQQQNVGLTRLVQLPPLSVTPTLVQPLDSQTAPSVGVDISSHSILGSVFGASFYDQQMASRQTSALSQQLEQFNMMDGSLSSSGGLYGPGSTLSSSQAALLGLSGSHGSLHDSQQLGYSSHSSIPNIILTGDLSISSVAGDALSKELASSLVGDDSFDADSQFPLDELKIDPLTLDGLHMLNDPDMVLTDPATEDAFRLDRL